VTVTKAPWLRHQARGVTNVAWRSPALARGAAAKARGAAENVARRQSKRK
jgi:hypothetical protein